MYQRSRSKVSFFVILSLLLASLLFVSSPLYAAVKATPPGMINSVLGPISPDKLGTTLVHEHFTFAYPGWFADATIAPEDSKRSLPKASILLLIASAWTSSRRPMSM